jgi:ketosteroid isomerase-like protein
MSEESTTPDPVELSRAYVEAWNRHDLDAVMSFFASDAVFDGSAEGIGTFVGVAAIRSFFDDWIGTFEEYESGLEEVNDLGNGVAFAVALQRGRLTGSDSTAQQRWSHTGLWETSVMSRMTVRADIDAARAAAERLAEERG